jgi:Fe-S-cluster-containing dehydrogenase component
MISCSLKHYGSTDFRKSHVKIINDPEKPKCRFVGIHCIHCEDPLCLASCPAKAITKDENTGLVKINSVLCIGCKACILACPISNPHFDEDRRVVAKCDFCDNDPQCVKFCTTEALKKAKRADARRLFGEA